LTLPLSALPLLNSLSTGTCNLLINKMNLPSRPRKCAAVLMAATAMVFMAAVASAGGVRGDGLIDPQAQSKVAAHARLLAANYDNLTVAVPTGERMLQTYTQSDDFTALMLAAVNAERTKGGLNALCTSAKLQAAAQGHSDDMASKNYMSHTGSDDSTMAQRINAQSYSWSALAENVAAGQVDVTAVMKSWMASEGHKANIMNAAYTQFGTGYAYSASSMYKHYWTQDFGTSSSEACAGSTSTTTTTPAKTTASPAAQTTTTPTYTTKTPASTTKTPTSTTKTPASTTTGTSMQAQMLAAVNAERAKVGVAALCTNSKLQSSAQGHSSDMASNNYMSHTGSDKSTMATRITAKGYKYTAIAENVAAGQVDVTAVVKAWMNSSGHRKNLLNAKYTHFGMGYAYSTSTTYKHYWTQDFGAGTYESCA
jgi:uncharacterized protein YkwD